MNQLCNIEEPFRNPYEMVYSKLLCILLEDKRFLQVANKPGNIIRFDTSDREPIKDNPISADYPEVMLIPGGITEYNPYHSSSSSRLSRNYQWIVSTGDYRVNDIFAVEWAIHANITRWCSELTQLTWYDYSFVKRVDPQGSDIGEQESLKRRGLNGWASALTLSVLMYFPTQYLREDQRS